MKKLALGILLVLFVISYQNSNAQKIIFSETALIVVDIQEFYFENGSLPLVKPEETSLNAKKALEAFRQNNLLVIHVKHNARTGAEIHKNVSPIEGEKVITKNEASSFNGTKLHEFLQEKKIKNVIICGMQTQMCVEATTRAAYDLGYKCTVIEDACTTRDLTYKDKKIDSELVHAETLASLKGAYAKITTVEELIQNLAE